jgi:hypothetical protein
MFREKRGGLVRTCPEGRQDREQNHDERKRRHQSERGRSAEELVAELVKQGCTITTALVGPGIKSPRSPDAQRKKEKREELAKKGWRPISFMAPDNPAAREFLTNAAKEVESKSVLKALRVTLDNPRVVRIGWKVLKLKGKAGARVRRALGL